jgi:hypothetical protein
MAGAQKKVIVRAAEGGLEWGYLPQSGFLMDGNVLLMVTDGKIKPIPISGIQSIAYVRDFNLDDAVDPERIGRRSFPARPRSEGLWLRLSFNTVEPLEGLAEFGLGMMDSLLQEQGLFLTPPDPRGNTQRLFIPRTALRTVEVIGFITSPSKRFAVAGAAKPAAAQTELFGE